MFCRRFWRGVSYFMRYGLMQNNSDNLCKEAVQVLFILGGSLERELECATTCYSGNESIVLLSSGAASANEIAAAAGIVVASTTTTMTTNETIVWVDGRAIDTVTNFTCCVDDLGRMGYRSVAIATSSSHMSRAYLVGVLVLGGGAGIRCYPRPCCRGGDDDVEESVWRTVRDVLRALLWLWTGFDGRTVAGWWHPGRLRASQQLRHEQQQQQQQVMNAHDLPLRKRLPHPHSM